MEHPGKLIVLEGIDGSGTTTQAKLLAAALRQRYPDREVVVTAEPTTGEIGQLIRKRIRAGIVPWHVMALLFAADRQEHNQLLLEPALRSGSIVICDRYQLSTICYQLSSLAQQEGHNKRDINSVARWHQVRSWLAELHTMCIQPHHTCVLQVSVDEALNRISQRSPERDAYERRDFLEHVAKLYAQADTFLPGGQVKYLDGERTPSEVTSSLLKVVAA